ncbi:MAG: class I SAM-dependent methyltransferase [Myxococcota bacterium]
MSKVGDGEILGTAEGAVLGRAGHTLHAKPPVLNDTWAIELLGEKSRQEVRQPDHNRRAAERAGFDPQPILAIGIGSLRYAEDAAEAAAERGVAQYVILGAGFDTFALRRADLVDRLRVFEVDYPDVQTLKKERIAAAEPTPASLPHFVDVDFETQRLGERLSDSPFDASKPSLFSWMNTIPYVSEEGTAATLRELLGCMAPGSQLVLNYGSDVQLTSDQAEYLMTVAGNVSAQGEPMKSRWKPEAFEALVQEVGFEIVEHISEQDLIERYFKDREDGLRPGVPGRLMTLTVR